MSDCLTNSAGACFAIYCVFVATQIWCRYDQKWNVEFKVFPGNQSSGATVVLNGPRDAIRIEPTAIAQYKYYHQLQIAH